MINIIRVIVVVLEAVSLILIAMDAYNLVNFKLNNITKCIIYIIFFICTLFLNIDGFLIWYNAK